jgi:hypothetical protein
MRYSSLDLAGDDSGDLDSDLDSDLDLDLNDPTATTTTYLSRKQKPIRSFERCSEQSGLLDLTRGFTTKASSALNCSFILLPGLSGHASTSRHRD